MRDNALRQILDRTSLLLLMSIFSGYISELSLLISV